MSSVQSLTADAIIALINAGTWPPNIAVTVPTTKLLGDIAAVDVHQASNLLFHVKNTGTVADAAGVVVFEGSLNSTNGTDGDWFAVQVARTNDNTIENGRAASSLAAGAVQAYGWEVSVVSLKWFRVRNTLASTVNAVMQWSFAPSATGSDPIPSISTHPVTISGTPAVTISGTATVSVSNTPAVTISGTPSVNNTPAAATAYLAVTAATTNAALIKATAGRLAEIAVYNSTAATIYVKLYNKSTAPAPATDGALILDIIPVAANTRFSTEYGAHGKQFAAGIGIAVTGAAAIADATATAAGAIVSLTYL